MAIVYVQSTTAENIGANSITNNFTGNGLASVSASTNGFVAVWIESGSASTPSAVTWTVAGVPQVMTLAQGSIATPGRGHSSLWYLLSPASGAVTVTVTYAVATVPVMVWSLYSGVKQVTPDTSTSATQASLASITISTTTITDNAWLVGGVSNNFGTTVAGSGTTMRFSSVRGVGDSNSAKSPTGSYSLIFQGGSGSSNWGAGLISIAPSVDATTNSGFFNFM